MSHCIRSINLYTTLTTTVPTFGITPTKSKKNFIFGRIKKILVDNGIKAKLKETPGKSNVNVARDFFNSKFKKLILRETKITYLQSFVKAWKNYTSSTTLTNSKIFDSLD